MTPLGTQTKKLPITIPFKPLKTDKYPIQTVCIASPAGQLADWAAGLLKLSCFFPFQDVINIRWEETFQGVKEASRGLPIEKEEDGEALSNERKEGSPAHQSFKEALCGWS